MAISKNRQQIEWSSSDSTSVSSGSTATSDAVTPSATVFRGSVQIKADNGGTPASGDTLDVYILYTTGDPDADPDSSDEYDTAAHGEYLFELDTNAEDPAIKTAEINVACKGFKIYVENNASSNSITASAQLEEILG